MNTCSLFYWQKLDLAPCTSRARASVIVASNHKLDWSLSVGAMCAPAQSDLPVVSWDISTIYYLLSTLSMYLLSTYGLKLEHPEDVVSPWEPRHCFTSPESWPGDLVTMGPCAGNMCHVPGVPMSGVTLALVSAPRGGQEATGGGPGRDHGDTGRCSAALWHQRTLHLHFLHCTTDTLCTTEHLHRLEVVLSHKPQCLCRDFWSVCQLVDCKSMRPQSAASADKPVSCTNVDTVELWNTMHRPVSCILEYFQLNVVVSARLCSVKYSTKDFQHLSFAHRPPAATTPAPAVPSVTIYRSFQVWKLWHF